jgi:hypothetical protein
MWLLSFIPTEVLYGIALSLVAAGLAGIFILTRSIQTTAFAAAMAGVAIGGWFYRDALIAQGEHQCAARVEAATNGLNTEAKTVIVDHRIEDQKRIAELEATNKVLAKQASDRETTRNQTKVSDACSQCMVPRAWMRGEVDK